LTSQELVRDITEELMRGCDIRGERDLKGEPALSDGRVFLGKSKVQLEVEVENARRQAGISDWPGEKLIILQQQEPTWTGSETW
jgi:hypothetical protein